MDYVRKILESDEKLIYRAAVHWIVFAQAVVFLLLGGGVLAWYGIERSPSGTTFFSSALLFVGLTLIAAGVFAFFRGLIERYATELAITSRRVIAKTGFIRRHTWEINAAKVEGVEVTQSVLGRIFDYGTVTVKGTGGGTAPIRDIAKPVVFRSHVTSL